MPLSQIVSASIEDGAVAPVDLSSVAQYTGFKNRVINGGMNVDQRNNGAAQTITNSAANVYCLDRWIVFTGGSNATTQQVASGVTGIPYVLQITGAAGNTAVQCSQKIESKNIADLAGSTVTLSAYLSNSVNTSAYWYAYYANSVDNFTAITQIATGTFTVNSTLNQYSVQISLPANAANGVQFVLGSATQTSGTFKVGNVQLEKGVTATSFDYRPYGTELALCQRYYWQVPASSTYGAGIGFVGAGQAWSATTTANHTIMFPVTMRANPTLFQSGLQIYSPNIGAKTATVALSIVSIIGAALNTSASTGLTGGNMWYIAGLGNATDYIGFGAEL
jgi:hypothetical protein